MPPEAAAATAGDLLSRLITVVHFWVDQFLGRMKKKELADWIRARFGYVLVRTWCLHQVSIFLAGSAVNRKASIPLGRRHGRRLGISAP
jgi:hypothetical protein